MKGKGGHIWIAGSFACFFLFYFQNKYSGPEDQGSLKNVSCKVQSP